MTRLTFGFFGILPFFVHLQSIPRVIRYVILTCQVYRLEGRGGVRESYLIIYLRAKIFLCVF